MTTTRHLMILVVALAVPLPSLSGDDLLVRAPGFPPTKVDAEGVIHEEWGAVALRLRLPQGAKQTGQHYAQEPVPTATTTVSAGPVTLAQTVYRAPIWPRGVDVLTAQLENTAPEPIEVCLDVILPEEVSLGERVGMLGGRAVLGLPRDAQPVRPERSWGCAGGVVPMPGWARPRGECDPAFRNISAGMGGVRISYRFAVPKGAMRTVVLGFCESHWSAAGVRPLEIYVEGTPKAESDPIAAWGRHDPGCLKFDAEDLNKDGRLQIVIAPHPRASDKNTILNVIWVFSPDVFVDTKEVLRGSLTSTAEYYVDVGGEKDQMLYEGKLSYKLRLEPNGRQSLTFLLASPGAGSVPNPETTTWTPETLRYAAEEVWAGWRTTQPE